MPDLDDLSFRMFLEENGVSIPDLRSVITDFEFRDIIRQQIREAVETEELQEAIKENRLKLAQEELKEIKEFAKEIASNEDFITAPTETIRKAVAEAFLLEHNKLDFDSTYLNRVKAFALLKMPKKEKKRGSDALNKLISFFEENKGEKMAAKEISLSLPDVSPGYAKILLADNWQKIGLKRERFDNAYLYWLE